MAEQTPTSFTNLPLDILLLIVPYLDAPSFLSLCSTCKALYDPILRLDAGYWRHATQTTFRVPNQPVIQTDAQRWRRLYKRLLTQSRIFTWGSNTHGCLGHSVHQLSDIRHPRMVPSRPRYQNLNASTPVEVDGTRELGVIADLQCGGWSTTLLTAKGVLYSVGVMDGLRFSQLGDGTLKPLRYPSPHENSPSAATTIQQFSAGRSHVLGLADSGRVWCWMNSNAAAQHIKFADLRIVDTEEPPTGDSESLPGGRVRQVVAGWSASSAYVTGLGILLWQTQNAETITERATVPKTGYQRPKGNVREPDEESRLLGENVGEIVSYIVLEHFVVFVTDIGRFFATKMDWSSASVVEDVVELRALRDESGGKSNAKIDIQGSFKSFAAFRGDEVITSNQDYLEACWASREAPWEDHSAISGLKRIPALQNSDVISVAFGDYHFHALHSNGRITSYGKEPQRCGAFGLGGEGDPEGRIRGIRYTGNTLDGGLVAHAYTRGRTIWFEPVKKQWIRFLTSGGKDPNEAKERMRMAVTDPVVQGELSEWFEQEGSDWDKHPDLQQYDEDGLGAYFALSVTAAGWHSGALVLVNEELAQKVEERCVAKAIPPQEQDQQQQLPPPAGDEATAQQESPDNSANNAGVSRLENIALWVNSWARWFLGMPDANNATFSPQTQAPGGRRPRHDATADHFTLLENYGASPGAGQLYVWAEDDFPRLRLSDGTEMPGRVPFREWKYGRPEWVLDADGLP
ncbi:uncharacterized protein K452DRAFT_290303 [Aplosporella prunicola CBS 121167]|uniref:F-box domain-containing protein n=1 Tax=Aplosporella prunicola CBS 121167 TaxID=1176127 RepID=A0A6A6B382_9PEZI|nr:uncharacterized protein K452DRAFT_290303 [Aplosporella prunicola CBS 121167]KAF2138649.1 hypothetical protein K452DRAFT_290303 [Aplosporella prunicola CBS 121167]